MVYSGETGDRCPTNIRLSKKLSENFCQKYRNWSWKSGISQKFKKALKFGVHVIFSVENLQLSVKELQHSDPSTYFALRRWRGTEFAGLDFDGPGFWQTKRRGGFWRTWILTDQSAESNTSRISSLWTCKILRFLHRQACCHGECMSSLSQQNWHGSSTI